MVANPTRELEQHLKELHLPTMRQCYGEQATVGILRRACLGLVRPTQLRARPEIPPYEIIGRDRSIDRCWR